MVNIPIAKKMHYKFHAHEHQVEDEYHWLRDKNWPNVEDKEVLAYLKAENTYYQKFFEPLQNYKNAVFEELKGKIKLADQSTYVKEDDYYYYTRTESDKDYPIYCRKFQSTKSKEEILLDVNKVADGQKFTTLGSLSISPDHKFLAYSVDFLGNEKFTIKLQNLQTKEYYQDEIPDTIGSIVWHEKIFGFFYTPATDNWRSEKVMFHKIGDNIKNDTLILYESNHLYQLSISKSSSRDYLFISSSGHDTNCVYYIEMQDEIIATPNLFKEKQPSILYDVDHNDQYFYIHTNDNAQNFRLARVRIDSDLSDNWPDYIKSHDKKYLTNFDITKNYLILNYKSNALPEIKILGLTNKEEKIIRFPDEAFTASAYSTNFDEDDIRINYSSMKLPNTVYKYNFNKHVENDVEKKPFNSLAMTVLKTQEIPSGFNGDEYELERRFVAYDGVEVPITIFYKKSLFKANGSNPLYLYGYGSYGISINPHFSNTAVTIADRGIVFAIAHVRGGDDLGYTNWYESAKFLNKKRTFNDFLSTAHYLIDNKYTSCGNIIICGGSAGGLLIGYALNQEPWLFKAAIAHVPFVDVINTMLDDTLPLTPGEFKEWGNPIEDRACFEYMLSYSPYDNIKNQKYPAILVTSGISDPRVGYWEAAKWVSRIRDRKTDNNQIIFKTNMDSGHRGASGRFDYLKEVAEDLVFTFNVFNISI
ncbi:MAG: S9 family peptidase [Rickettsiaceae bacterium]